MKKPINVIMVLVMSLSAIFASAGAMREKTLERVHADVLRSYKEVRHISTEATANKLGAGDVVLFDVRETAEYEISHIVGAILISPKMKGKEFLTNYGETLSGKRVVFYCSVGHRSSKLAGKVQSILEASGVKAVYNLEGGLFKWHNEQRPLVTVENQPTDAIHPYNKKWGKLLNRQEMIQY